MRRTNAGLATIAGLAIVACSTADPNAMVGENSVVGAAPGVDVDADAPPTFAVDAGRGDGNPYANDPPPQWCGPSGGPMAPPPPGGSLACPADKNLEGCPCTHPGETAACWPGLRANRDLGICKDGVTTCVQRGELDLTWGPCVGATLPQPSATKGAPACKCFSAGEWKLTNLEPCFWSFDGVSYYAVSTVLDAAGNAHCPQEGASLPLPVPPTSWSEDTIDADCAGHFQLCYELKAGDAANPSPSDCSLAKTCVQGDYLKEKVAQPFPSLGPWASNDAACAKRFMDTGGYGEMSVIGLSVRCDKIDDGNGEAYVFNRVRYCKAECATNPSAAGCQSCGQGGSGSF